MAVDAPVMAQHRITVGEELRYDADVRNLHNLSGTYASVAATQSFDEATQAMGRRNLGLWPLRQVPKASLLKLPARGYFSGVSGGTTVAPALGDGGFGTWRGDPTDAYSMFVTFYQGDHVTPGSVTNFDSQATTLLDVAIGGPDDGWSNAAAGSYDAVLYKFLAALRAKRTVGGVVAPTIIRPYHEMNGTWYLWSVPPGALQDFKATARRWRRVADTAFPEALWAFVPNPKGFSHVNAEDYYEDGLYDILGAEPYNRASAYVGTSGITWATAIAQGTQADPQGLAVWQQFAAERGLPIYLPEYANDGTVADDVTWMNTIQPWIRANCGTGPGQVVAEMIFNATNQGTTFTIYPTTAQPLNAAAYQAQHAAADLTQWSWDLQLEPSNLSVVSDGATVQTWTGIAGSATQATSGKRPKYRTAGPAGYACLEFDGVDDMLASAVTGGPAPRTFFVLAKPGPLTISQSNDTQYALLGNSNAGGFTFDVNSPTGSPYYVNPYQDLEIEADGFGSVGKVRGATTTDGWHLFVCRYASAGAYTIRLDGAALLSGTSAQNTTTTGVIQIGAAQAAKFFSGKIAAVFAKKALLTDSQIVAAESAIMAKYGITRPTPTPAPLPRIPANSTIDGGTL